MPLSQRSRTVLLKFILFFTATVVLVSWVAFTPPGLLDKADAVGYAVCHRISERAFRIGDRPMPLCARCSGMHLGALAGLLLQLPKGRRGGLPARKVQVVLGLLFLAFGVDGVNSYAHFFPGLPSLYDPHNILRLVTGTGLGLGIAALVYPVFNQTVWADWDPAPCLASWKDLGALLAAGSLVVLAVISEIPAILYPLAVLSSFNVILVLTLIYSMAFTLLVKRDNTFHSLGQYWMPLTVGFILCITQIALFDALRFWLTGTWAGFSF